MMDGRVSSRRVVAVLAGYCLLVSWAPGSTWASEEVFTDQVIESELRQGTDVDQHQTMPSAECRDRFRLALDVGHTKELPGTLTARGKTEYELNLKLANSIRSVLSARGFANVSLIVVGGGLESLRERVQKANKLSPHLVLSIHHDSAQPKYFQTWIVNGIPQNYSDRFSGFSLFVSEKNQAWKQSFAFAQLLSSQLLASNMHFTLHHAERIEGENRPLLDPDKGIYRYDDLIVLKGSQAPAVLLEAAVVINRDEEIVAVSDERQQVIGNAVTKAVEEYCQSLGDKISLSPR